MAIEALQIQAEITEDEVPFDVSPLLGKTGGKDADHLLASTVSLEEWVTVSLEEWVKNGGLALKEEPRTLTLLVVVQLRDPLRRYEAVGSPVIALIQATCVDAANVQEEERFKLASLHIGGLKVRAGGKRHAWDAEKQRLTAMQWLLVWVGEGCKERQEYADGRAGLSLEHLCKGDGRCVAQANLKSKREVPQVTVLEETEPLHMIVLLFSIVGYVCKK